MVTLSFLKKAIASLVVAYAIIDITIIIRINLKIFIKTWNVLFGIFLIKSAETFAFKKNALGIAKNATSAIPNSTNSIVPVTGELRNLLPNTSQKVNTAKDNNINPEIIAERSNMLLILNFIR